MIGQYLPNNNETTAVAFRQKIYQLNSHLEWLPCYCSLVQSSIYAIQSLASLQDSIQSRQAQPPQPAWPVVVREHVGAQRTVSGTGRGGRYSCVYTVRGRRQSYKLHPCVGGHYYYYKEL
jgi:hypothetical protein